MAAENLNCDMLKISQMLFHDYVSKQVTLILIKQISKNCELIPSFSLMVIIWSECSYWTSTLVGTTVVAVIAVVIIFRPFIQMFLVKQFVRAKHCYKTFVCFDFIIVCSIGYQSFQSAHFSYGDVLEIKLKFQ